MDWHCPPPEEEENLVNFNCSMLNERLGPAFRPGNVIELFGEAGSAKTQFCLHLAIQTLRKRSGIVLYVATERPFPTKRAHQMLRAHGLSDDILDRVITKTTWESSHFFELIDTQIMDLCKVFQLDLIMVDSIAGPLRSEFEKDKKFARAKQIHRIGFRLNELARILNIPVLVCNQVTAVIDQKQMNFGRSVLPCFGLSWTNYVHTRIYLHRTPLTIECDSLPTPNSSKTMKIETRVRIATVDFSPVLPNYVTKFIVDNSGIRGLEIKD